MREERTLRVAEFTPKVQTYWLLTGTITCAFLCLALIGFVLLPLWLVFGGIFTTKYRQSLSCVLTERSLKFSKGVLTRVEKTVPLEKITDLGMVQGPIMRHFGLHGLTVETAGQTAGPGALVSLVGIVDAVGFRNAVLEQRDRVVFEPGGGGRIGDGDTPAAPGSSRGNEGGGGFSGSAESAALLADIRDTLGRIEQELKDRPR